MHFFAFLSNEYVFITDIKSKQLFVLKMVFREENRNMPSLSL